MHIAENLEMSLINPLAGQFLFKPKKLPRFLFSVGRPKLKPKFHSVNGLVSHHEKR